MRKRRSWKPLSNSFVGTAFKRIRKGARNGLAVVYVQRGACGGCFNKIPPQKQLDSCVRKLLFANTVVVL